MSQKHFKNQNTVFFVCFFLRCKDIPSFFFSEIFCDFLLLLKEQIPVDPRLKREAKMKMAKLPPLPVYPFSFSPLDRKLQSTYQFAGQIHDWSKLFSTELKDGKPLSVFFLFFFYRGVCSKAIW